jgi:tetratricopeptide (TPR) repeat protein
MRKFSAGYGDKSFRCLYMAAIMDNGCSGDEMMVGLDKTLLAGLILCYAGYANVASRAADNATPTRGQPPLSSEEVNRLLESANKARDEGRPMEASRVLGHLAMAYYSHGQFGDALSLYEQIASMENIDKADRIVSMRMAAQISMLNVNQPERAEKWCRAVLTAVEGLGDYSRWPRQGDMALAQGQVLHFQAQLQERRGDGDGAFQTRQRLLNEVKGFPDDRILNHCYWEVANHYLERGDYQGAVRTFDKLLQKLPEFIQEKGILVEVRLRRAQAHGYDRTSPEHLRLLEEIWNDRETTQYLKRYEVGRQLIVFSYWAGDYERVLRYGAELLNKLESEFEKMKVEDRRRYGIETVYSESLSYMADAYIGLGLQGEAIPYLERLMTLFPESPCGSSALDRLKEIGEAFDGIVSEMLEHPIVVDGNSISTGLENTVVKRDTGSKNAPDHLGPREDEMMPDSPGAGDSSALTGNNNRAILASIGISVSLAAVILYAVMIRLKRQRTSHR